MSEVRTAMLSYVRPVSFNVNEAELGPRRTRVKTPTFAERLQAAQVYSRRWARLCAIMLLLLFGIVLFVSYRFFDQLVALGPTGVGSVSGIFGFSASGAVLLMMRWAREAGRAEQLLVLLGELGDRDDDALTRIIDELLRKWYGLPVGHSGPAAGPAGSA